MPLIKDATEIEDIWAFIEDDAELSEGGRFTVTLDRWIAEADRLSLRNEAIGVRLSPADDPHLLAPYLDKLTLIEVSFPKYTDGRGYSQAQLLRRRLGYTGELRAVGHVKALQEYAAFYQPAADGNPSVFARRHTKA